MASMVRDPNLAIIDKGVKGGIDFNTALLNLVVRKEGTGVQMTVSSSALENLNLGGFEPIITKVGPVQSLQHELGLDI